MSKFTDAVRKGQAVLEEAETRSIEEAKQRAKEHAKYRDEQLVKARAWVADELPKLITAATIAKRPEISLQHTGSGIPPVILAQARQEESDLLVRDEYVPADYDPDGAYTHDGYTAYYVRVKSS